LTFTIDEETGKKTLVAAEFCREPLCPMCNWRKSLKVFTRVSQVMDKVEERYNNLVPLFLTLTIRNCGGGEFGASLDAMFRSWNTLMNHKKVKRVVKGWFRVLEVTYNVDMDTYHPHFHAILLVDKSYFTGPDYIHTTEWVERWGMACKLDYAPICDIRKVRTPKGQRKEVAEVAKYTLKDGDYLFENDNELTDRVVDVLSGGLHGRRLYAFGGVMKAIAKELGAAEPADGDLVHISGETMREDVAQLFEMYRWDYGLRAYFLLDREVR
jgi:plasmid rolling circle replication initiator protein Rep